MARDWRPEIDRLVEVKTAIYDADGENLWDYRLPNAAASEEALQAAERALGFALEPAFREFLGFANGWPAFFQTVDLFGTDDLMGSPKYQVAQEMLTFSDSSVWERTGLSGALVVPIAATAEDRDVFVMPVREDRQQPPVVWTAAYEIESFGSFEEYFHEMIRYNERELDRVTGRR